MQAQYNDICYSPRSSYIDRRHAAPNAYSAAPDSHCATSGGEDFCGSFSRGSPSLAYLPEYYQYLTGPGEPTCLDSSSSAGNLFSSTAYAPALPPPTQTMVNTTFGSGLNIGCTEDGNILVSSNGLIAAFERGAQHGHPEEVPAFYQDPRWEWDYHSFGEVTTVTPLLRPLHALPCSYPYQQPTLLPMPSNPVSVDLTSSAIKSAAAVEYPRTYPATRSPTATQTLSAPATPMGASPSPNRRRKERVSRIAVDTAHLPPLQPSRPGQRGFGVASEGTTGQNPHHPDALSREKKHACTMCHKRFDRPSTLRKHLLVHTGEKAFVCETCGRRFGVASNLNRHIRRCILKPVNAPALSAMTTPISPSSHITSSEMFADLNVSHGGEAETLERGRTLSSTGSESALSSSSPSSPDQPPAQRALTVVDGGRPKAPSKKRRRRAPSPSVWVPLSLKGFNLACEELHMSTPLPLPPVRRNLPTEERDSWDENVSSRPYHPQGWKGVLPGPGFGSTFGLGGKDIRNINLGGNGGIVLGRLLVC